MKNFFLIVILVIGCILGVVSLIIHRSPETPVVQGQRISVVCTTGMIADVVRQIGGDAVQVHALMGPGVDPHLYAARESDVQRLASADIIFYNGLHLEGKMGQLFERMGQRVPTYAVTDALARDRLRSSGFKGLYDPHVWFDVAFWVEVAKGIRDRLMQHDPRNADLYQKRADAYINELIALDAYIRDKIVSIPVQRRILITAHDAFGYFGAAYGFTVVGLQGISTDSEVGTADVMRLVDIIVANDVPALFTEASIPQRNIEAVQCAVQARGKRIVIGDELYSDTLGEPGTMAETYVGMVRSNVDTIVTALA